MGADSQQDAVMSPKQVAALLGVSATAVRRWINVGFLPATRLPGMRPRYSVKRKDALALLDRPVKAA
jgi:excisionase family DNA binding protein